MPYTFTMRTALILTLTGIVGFAQGTESKRKLADWPLQATAGSASIGAEFMVRLISYGTESFVTNNFLVVEVALYPQSPLDIRLTDWTMKVNGKKETLHAQPPQVVAAYLRYPNWEMPPVGAQAGDVGERFPGDPRARRYPMPRTPGPVDGDVDQQPEQKRLSAGEVVNKASLPEGPRKTPVSGLLFFPWKGNPEKLKSVELTTTMGSGDPVTIRLR
jgi:hypothetical protein